MSANPSALVRLWREFEKHEPDVLLGGIYANKGGYHNTRNNHRRNRPNDYSIQAAADRRGPGDKAAAVDLTFRSAQRSDFRIIAKYTRRLINAMKRRDRRLFYKGQAVVRECFGNADNDRSVEGWSLYRGYAVSSDPSHLWHIHISFHRQFVENWDACKGVLDVLLDRDGDEKDWLEELFKNEAEFRQAVRHEVWLSMKKNVADMVLRADVIPNRNNDKNTHMSLIGAVTDLEDTQDKIRAEQQRQAATQERILEGLQTLFAKFDALAEEVRENDKPQPPVIDKPQS